MWPMIVLLVLTLLVALVTIILTQTLPLAKTMGLNITLHDLSIIFNRAGNNSLVTAMNGIYVIFVGTIVMLFGKWMWSIGLSMPAHIVKFAGACLLLAGGITILATFTSIYNSAPKISLEWSVLVAFMYLTASLALLNFCVYGMYMLKHLSGKKK